MVINAPEAPVSNGSTLMPQDNSFKSIVKNINADKFEINDIINAVKIAIVDVTKLEITTWVPESPIQPGDEPQNSIEKAQPGNRIHTVINLIDGDISNEIGSQFVDNGPYAELREFHLTQVKESQDIMQKNIDSIHKLYVILMELYKSRKIAQKSGSSI